MNNAAEEYDEIVARIYDAGAGRIDWHEALAPLAGRFDLWWIALFGVARDSRNPLFLCDGGPADPAGSLEYLRIYHRIDPHIGPALALGCGRGQWLHGRDRFDDDFVARDPFHQEFLLPHGGRHTAGAKLFEDGDAAALLLLQRGQGRPPLGEEDIGFFDRLRPHLASALRLHLERQGRFVADVDLACRIFSRMRQALVLADGELRIAYRNPAARRLLARANAFSERNGRLVCRNRDDDSRLRIAVNALAGEAAPEGAPGHSVIRVIGSGFINPVMVLATGLPPAAHPAGRQPGGTPPAGRPPGTAVPPHGGASVILLLHETARRRQVDPAVIAEVFQLTPAEAEVATGLAEGLSIEEIAAARGVTLETIRAQIRAVYGKTAVRSRADLVRMLLEMPSFDRTDDLG